MKTLDGKEIKHTKKVLLKVGQPEVEIEWRELSYDTNFGRESRWHLGDTEFDGHHDLFEIEIREENYLKSSHLSGDEYRKGGSAIIKRNGRVVWEKFHRDASYAILDAVQALRDLKAFMSWDKVEVGSKLFYRDIPVTVTMFTGDGCLILETEDGKPFPRRAWQDEENDRNGIPYEADKSVKVEILSPDIWWWRS